MAPCERTSSYPRVKANIELETFVSPPNFYWTGYWMHTDPPSWVIEQDSERVPQRCHGRGTVNFRTWMGIASNMTPHVRLCDGLMQMHRMTCHARAKELLGFHSIRHARIIELNTTHVSSTYREQRWYTLQRSVISSSASRFPRQFVFTDIISLSNASETGG